VCSELGIFYFFCAFWGFFLANVPKRELDFERNLGRKCVPNWENFIFFVRFGAFFLANIPKRELDFEKNLGRKCVPNWENFLQKMKNLL
jgi:hypothetical protein